MSAFDLTDADAQGLDALAAAQLRLALRFAERAEAGEDDDAACKLARASERAARSYRQALLVKLKLKRGLPPERPAQPRTSVMDDPVFIRMGILEEAVERLRDDERLDDQDDAWMTDFADEVDDMIADGDFAHGDVVAQFARICRALDLPFPAWAAELADTQAATDPPADPKPADSS